MKRRIFLQSIAPLVLPSRLVFAQSEVWEPGNRSSRFIRDGKKITWQCRSESNPVYYSDSTGKLLPISFDSEQSTNLKSASRVYTSSLPLKAYVPSELTTEKSVFLRSDKDWANADTGMLVTLTGAKFDSVSNLSTKSVQQSRISANVRTMGDDFALHQTRSNAKLCSRIPGPFTTFEITYRIEMTGVVFAGKVDKGGYVSQNSNGEYLVTSPKGEFRCRIRKPKLLDESFEVISDHTEHSLRYVSPGVYEYKKTPSKELTEDDVKAAVWIDADAYYSTTADGLVSLSGSDWSTVRNSTTGASSDNTATAVDVKAQKISTAYYVSRGFFYYDLTGVSGSIDSGSLYFYPSGVYNSPDVSVQQGTQESTINTNSYNDFSGTYYGQASIVASQYNEITLNSVGKTAISNELGSTSKVCVRNYTYDYMNSQPAVAPRVLFYSSNQSGTDYDPYLSIVVLADVSSNPFMGVAF